jgi:hypothetical protein
VKALSTNSFVLGAAAAISVLAAPTGNGSVQASRIIDRTVICRSVGTGFPDPIRVMTLTASPRNDALKLPPILSAHNGPSGEGGVSAFIQTGPDPSHPTGYVSLSRTRCAATKLRIPLSTRGLRGGSAAPYGKRYKCDAPARILIRVRAVFTRPTRFSGDAGSPWLSVARGTIATASMVVAAMPGRTPLSLFTANHTAGASSLFVARSRCHEET